MVPIGQLFGRFPRIVREVAREGAKQARLELVGADTELDKTLVEHLGDPLIHLVRNAVDHGLEPPAERVRAGKPAEGVVTLAAAQRGSAVVVTVADDGRGIDRARVLAKARSLGWFGPEEEPSDAELHAVLFRPGFSTAAAVTSISGRGVGMDVVRADIQRLGGTVQVAAAPGGGTRFEITLPLTLVSARALLARAGDRTLAIPLAAVVETLRVAPGQHWCLRGRDVLSVRERVLPLLGLERWLGVPDRPPEVGRPAVVIGDGGSDHVLLVDELIGQQDVVVKPLGAYLGTIPGVGGATILADGQVAMILDAAGLLRAMGPGGP
jgi:two-component system chemotaxis sensor kinase CheA